MRLVAQAQALHSFACMSSPHFLEALGLCNEFKLRSTRRRPPSVTRLLVRIQPRTNHAVSRRMSPRSHRGWRNARSMGLVVRIRRAEFQRLARMQFGTLALPARYFRKLPKDLHPVVIASPQPWGRQAPRAPQVWMSSAYSCHSSRCMRTSLDFSNQNS